MNHPQRAEHRKRPYLGKQQPLMHDFGPTAEFYANFGQPVFP
ncbi:hypothetical protein [Glutamicibacter uratoxydans]|nr:hypothetical protein [Glutamicibacter uratoxydans]